MMKEIHLICNAHIDAIWQWDWQEGVSAVLSTFSSAIRLLDKHDYIFCHNEVTVYKYVEEYAPQLFERIRELVKEGRWHIMGGWYLQPDCNMPSGESFVRQILEGKRYFLEKFGVFPTVAVNFDPFGHTRGLVQIIKKCGQNGYIFMRPYPRELDLPSEQFLWRGLDGSEIKAVRCGAYNSPLGGAADSIRQKVKAQSFDVGMAPWGVGNHGGGPSDKDLTDIKAMMSDAEIPYLHSTPEAFFAKIHPQKQWDRSLRISMPGCYTSMYRLKSLHAALERELFFTEKILSVAYAQGVLSEYPEEKLHEITQDLLNAEFHDVLPGTSIRCGEENGRKLLYHGLLEAERLKTKAYFALSSRQLPAAEGEYPILVFNPHPYALVDTVTCEFMLADQNWDPKRVSQMTVKDERGNTVPYQLVKEESNLSLDWRKKIIFEAALPPLALRRFSVYVTFAEQREEKPKHETLIYDDGRKYVRIDERTGLLASYCIDGVEYVKDGFLPVAFDDNADPWAMDESQLARLGTNEVPFRLSEHPSGVFEHMKSIQVIEDGDIYYGVEVFFEHKHTRARMEYKIYKRSDYVDIDVDLFMGDIDTIIKLKLPMNLNGTLIGQTAFGTEELFTDGRENAAHRFVGIRNGDTCLALLNNGVYGSHYENGALYMSLCRGATYCAHPIPGRPLLAEGRYTAKMDQGEHHYSFRLGLFSILNLERETQQFLERPFAQNIFPVPSQAASYRDFDVHLDDETVTLVTLKKADGEEALLFRLLNNSDREVQTTLTVNASSCRLAFSAYEVKTVYYANGDMRILDELRI